MQARGYRIMVIMTAFQAEDGGSIPPTRFYRAYLKNNFDISSPQNDW